jgi:hypothetical protein
MVRKPKSMLTHFAASRKKEKRFESRQERKTCTPRIRQIQIPHQREKKPRKKDS